MTPAGRSESFRNVALIGFMGSGKSTIGRMLADDIGWEFIDSDDYIEKRYRMTIARIFKERGEPAFRNMEVQTIRRLVLKKNAVIALGGGSIVSPQVRKIISAHSTLVIWLKVSVAKILERTGKSSHRPLLNSENPEKVIRDLLRLRSPYYSKCADICINGSLASDCSSIFRKSSFLSGLSKNA